MFYNYLLIVNPLKSLLVDCFTTRVSYAFKNCLLYKKRWKNNINSFLLHHNFLKLGSVKKLSWPRTSYSELFVAWKDIDAVIVFRKIVYAT